MMKKLWWLSAGTGALAVALGVGLTPIKAGQQRSAPPSAGEISGAVTSAKGPEAGVWVIAETTQLPTKYIKIVVTDDRGRYLLPDLPKASYDVWVRGYGLVDSPKVKGQPGQMLNLKASVA